jgi:transaldolase
MIAEGRNINVTLIFSLDRYADGDGGVPLGPRGVRRRSRRRPVAGRVVASFFISRADTEVDRRLEAIGTPEALELRGTGRPRPGAGWRTAASGGRSAARAGRPCPARGARVQRPLWASTGTKNEAYSDVMYVDG